MADHTEGASIAQSRIRIVRSHRPARKINWASNHVTYSFHGARIFPYHLVAGLSSQTRLGDRVRVIREHSVERESVPSVFDVFNIGESSQDRNRSSPVREPAVSRYTSIAGAYIAIESLLAIRVTLLAQNPCPHMHLKATTTGQVALLPSRPRRTPTKPLQMTSTLASTPRGHPFHLPTPSCPKVHLSDDTPLLWSDSAHGCADQVSMRTTSRIVDGQAAREASVSVRVVVIQVPHRRYRRVRVWRVCQGLEQARISPRLALRVRRCRRRIG